METINNLSPAELELIRINREKEALAKQEKQAKLELDKQKNIQDMDKEVKEFEVSNEKKNETILNYFQEINSKYPNVYQIKTTETSKDFSRKEYYTEEERTEKGITEKYATYVLAELELKYIHKTIERVDNPKIYISVAPHTTGESYKRHTEMRLFVNGCGYDQEKKALKNIATAHKNIQEFIDTTKRKQQNQQDSNTGWDMLFKEVSKEFAEDCLDDNAKIEKETKWVRSGDRGYEKQIVKITFKNGLVVSYSFRYYQDNNNNGKMVFIKDFYEMETNKLDKSVMVNMLKNI